MDELRGQVFRLRDQLSTSQQQCNAVEAQLSLRDGQLVHKSDQLQFIEAQVGAVFSFMYFVPRAICLVGLLLCALV